MDLLLDSYYNYGTVLGFYGMDNRSFWKKHLINSIQNKKNAFLHGTVESRNDIKRQNNNTEQYVK